MGAAARLDSRAGEGEREMMVDQMRWARTMAAVAAASGAMAGAAHAGEIPAPGPPIALPPDPSTGRACPDIASQGGLDGDASADARAGASPLFRRVQVEGVSDNDNGGLNGALPALVDLDRDGRTDIVLSRRASLEVFLNEGCLRFTSHPIKIVDSPYTESSMPAGNQGLTFADFNGDGFLDPLITGPKSGNELLFSQGAFDTFKDVTGPLGVANTGAYNRQVQVGDVNRDGYSDIAIGADQIGTPNFGSPYQRLYVYDPKAGRFNDIGGTPLVPGFGGAPNCDPRHDRNSPGILLRDLSGYGALDLVQGYHNDMNLTRQDQPCVTGERDYGIFAWRNRSPALGTLQYEHIGAGANGLTDLGRMRYNPVKQDYDVVTRGVGLPYIVAFDAFNTGRLDLLAIGPTDPEWHVNSDMIAGRFFRNRGDFRFQDATDAVGLASLNWTYKNWASFWDAPPTNPSKLGLTACSISNRKPTCLKFQAEDHQFYMSSVVWGDFDNDGNLDFIVADRHEDPDNTRTLRNVLYLNTGRGRFRPVRSQVSGIDTNTESTEAADLNGDGLLDLVTGVQPSNSNPLADTPGYQLPPERSYTKVYLNTGTLRSRKNHWLELQLSGAPARRLIGAQLRLTASNRRGRARRFLGRRDLFPSDAYKASHDLVAHWGLGTRTRAHVAVRLPSGKRLAVRLPCVDARLTINVRSSRVTGCRRTASATTRHQSTR